MPIQLSGSLVITGSITTTGVITMSGSIASASYSSNSDLLQGTGSVGFTTTGSFTTMSGSVSSRVSQIENVYATTGSNSFRATQSITGSLTVTGQIIAQTLNVQQVTSSIVYSSGSNVFGCDLNSRQTFTGSVLITGSLNTVGNTCVTSICSPTIVGGTVSGTTIYGSTAICGAVICGGATTLTGALSGTSATFSSSVTASSLIKSGGTSSQYLMADGSTSTLTNPVTGTGTTNYLPKWTSASAIGNSAVTDNGTITTSLQDFHVTKGNALLSVTSTNTGGFSVLRMQSSTIADLWFGRESSTSSIFGLTASSSVIYSEGAFPFLLWLNGATRLTIASTGIACFACQVCAPSFIGGTVSGTTIYGSTAVCAPSIISSGTICSTGNTCFGGMSIIASCLGIGTASPSSILTVLKTITTSFGAKGNAALSLGTAGSAGEANLINFGYDAESWQPAYMGYLTTSGAGSSNGALVFATRDVTTNTQPTERMRITSGGNVGINCTSPGQLLTVNGASSFKCHQQHPAGQWYKIPFYIDKNQMSGTATTKCLVVINNNDSFQELHFTIEYGSRLQGVSDQSTQTSLRSYGVNRFNNGTIAVCDTYLITGGSGCTINTHAPMTVATVGTCMTVVKVDFSCSVSSSSFVWGEVRIWSIESLVDKITISNNSY